MVNVGFSNASMDRIGEFVGEVLEVVGGFNKSLSALPFIASQFHPPPGSGTHHCIRRFTFVSLT